MRGTCTEEAILVILVLHVDAVLGQQSRSRSQWHDLFALQEPQAIVSEGIQIFHLGWKSWTLTTTWQG